MSLIENITHKLGIERSVAMMAALTTALMVLLMPGGVLQRAVLASGLSSVFSPLEPPLGVRARFGLALLAAGFAFGLVVALVKAAERWDLQGLLKTLTRPAPRVAAETAAPARSSDALQPPRLRRRDRHPDAPPRAPLLIEREVGAPLGRVVDQSDEYDEVEPLILSDALADDAAEDEIEELRPAPFFRSEIIEDEAVKVEAELPAAPAAEPVAEDEEAFAWERRVGDRRGAPSSRPARPSWMEAPSPAASGQVPIGDLVARLERALHKRAAAVRRSEPVPQPASFADERQSDGTEDRLRAALDSLKKFAPQRA